MGDMHLTLQHEDGSKSCTLSIASNEDHVANLIAEGVVSESDRWREIARLYKGQLADKQRDLVEAEKRLRER